MRTSASLNTDNATGDAFGRLRVAMPETLFDSKQLFDAQPLVWDDQQVSGSGTASAHSPNNSSTVMSVSATTAGRRVRQTFRRINYQPGKSQFALLTGVLDNSGGGAGITRGVGLYDDNNGIFIKDDQGTIKLVVRSNTSGTPVDTEVAQSAWNLDKMDGTGPSRITLDPTKAQILVIDFEWLGVGRIRCGFNVDGVTIYCHEFLHANNVTTVYMTMPNLPVRYEIKNDGTGAASSLRHICTSIASEGGSQEVGRVFYTSTAGTHVDANVENTVYAVLGLRLQSARVAETVKLLNVAVQLQSASSKCEWTLRLNPTVAGTWAASYAAITNTSVEKVTGVTANTVTGGTILAGGYVESGGASTGGSGRGGGPLDNALQLGAAINGTVDQVVLCIMPIGGSTNVDAEGSFTWRELS